MNIAILSGATFPCPSPAYGSETATFWLAEALGQRGHTVHLFGPGGSHSPTGGFVHYIPGAYGQVDGMADHAALTWYRDILATCDIVHDLSPSLAVYEDLLWEDPAWPLLATRNGIDFSRPRWLARNMVVLSEAARQAALHGWSAWKDVPGYDAWDRPPGSYREAKVVHYGIDTAFYHPEGIPQDEVLYIGRPHPSKGVDLLLAAARRLPDQPFRFAWRAAAPDHVAYDRIYRDQAADLPNVTIETLPEVGHHAAKRTLYQQARVMVSLNRYCEAFGLTATESLACGTPVILGTHGAGPEIVQEGVTGTCLNATASDAIDQLVDVLQSGNRWDRAACRADALARWTADRMAQDYEALYAAVMRGETW